jgi:capsular exopolysaccharide synthesis family protein
MSRIDEALRQAGLKSGEKQPNEKNPHEVDALHVFPEGERAQRSEPAPVVPNVEASPRLDRPPTGSRRYFPVTEKLVIHDATGPACVEQYRRIAGTLHQLQEERGLKVLMVASAQVGEGKTLTAANLALTLSESYRRRVLLIDADLRRPSLSTLFRIQRVRGLSESLQGPTGGPLQVLELSEYLSLLPSGKPNPDPMASLTSGRMQRILERAAADHDWVIVDTPPVSLQPDANLMAPMVEGVVFVIGAGLSQRPVILSSIDAIGRDKIVGVVINRVDPASLDQSAYYDYYNGQPPVAPPSGPLSREAVGT